MFYFATDECLAFKLVEDRHYKGSQNGVLFVLGKNQGKILISAEDFIELCSACEQCFLQKTSEYYAILNLLTNKEDKILVNKGFARIRDCLIYEADLQDLSQKLKQMENLCFDFSSNKLVSLESDLEISFNKEKLNISSSDKSITNSMFDFYANYFKVLGLLSTKAALQYLNISRL